MKRPPLLRPMFFSGSDNTMAEMTKPAKVFMQILGGSVAVIGTLFLAAPNAGPAIGLGLIVIGGGILLWARNAGHPDDKSRDSNAV